MADMNIDQLSIQITSSSESAVAGINNVVAALQSLQGATGSASALNSVASNLTKVASAAASLNGTQFSNFASGIRTMAGSLSSLGSIDKTISQTVNSLGRLGKVGESLNGTNFTTLTSQLQSLANALTPLTQLGKINLGGTFNQLKRLPEVVETLKTVDMSAFTAQMQKLASAISPVASKSVQLSSVFSKLPTSVTKATNSLSRYDRQASKSARSSSTLSDKINKVYAKLTMFHAVGAMVTGALNSAFEESSSYIENLNLFTVSMGNATESARKYADEVARAMGIDPSEWMRYQGSFNMMATGFGVSSDKAAIMSKNLTQLAYDYSSLMNVDVETAFDKLNSAMSGQIKGLKEFGNNVSVAAVKETGLKYGLTGAVSSWDMNTQAMMRYVTIMNNAAKVDVFNDMARTLVTPANAVRILSQQFTLLKRAVGNVVSVFASAAIPYIQTFIQLVTQAVTWLANLFGFELPKIDYSDMDAGFSDAADSAEDLADDTGSAADNVGSAVEEAKELKKQLMGFDELNIINAPDKDTADTGGGSGGGGGAGGGGGSLGDIKLPEYDFLKGLTNDAEKRLQALKDELARIFEPVAESWNTYGAGVLSSILYSWREVSNLISDIGKSFGTVWQNGTGVETVSLILQIITNMNMVVGILANRFDEAWNHAGLGTAIIQNLWDSFNNLLACAKNVTDQLVVFAYNLDFKPLLKSVANITSSFKDFTKVVGEYVSDAFRNVLIPLAKWTIEKVVPSLVNTLAKALSAVNSALKTLKPFISVLEKVATALIKLVGNAILKGLDLIASALEGICSCKPLVIALTSTIIAFTAAMEFQKAISGVGLLGGAFTALSQPILAIKNYGLATVIKAWGETSTSTSGVVQKLVGAFTTFNSTTGILSGVSTAITTLGVSTGALTVAEGGATVATGVLGTALNFLAANPAVAVIGAIALAVAAVIGLSNAFGDTSAEEAHAAEMAKISAQVDQVAESNKAATESYTQMKDSLKESLGSANSDYLLQTNYLDRLIAMTGGKDGYVGNIQEAKTYVDEVNKACADSVRINEDGLVVWQKTPEAIRAEIQALKEKAALEAYEEQYKTARKEELTVRNNLSSAISAQSDAQKKYNDFVQECKELGLKGEMLETALAQSEQNKELNKANDELAKAQQAVDNNKRAQNSLDTAITAATGSIDEQAKANADLVLQNKGTKASMGEFAAGFESLRDKVATTTGEEQQMYIQSKNKLIETLTEKAAKYGWETDDIERKLKAHGVVLNDEEKKQVNQSLTTAKTKQAELTKTQQGEYTELLALFKEYGIDLHSQTARDYLQQLQDAQKAGGDQGRGIIDNLKKEYSKKDYTNETKNKNDVSQSWLKNHPLMVGNKVNSFDASNPFNSTQGWLNRNPLLVSGRINMSAPKGLSGLFGGALSVMQNAITFYAKGGLPDVGQMFVAREAGPEMVGRIGNKNAVANNNQIVSGIAAGVYNAVTSAMATANGGDVKIAVYPQLNGRTIGESFVEYHNGVVKQTGNSPLNT